MKKKLIAIVASLAMVATMVPATAFAGVARADAATYDTVASAVAALDGTTTPPGACSKDENTVYYDKDYDTYTALNTAVYGTDGTNAGLKDADGYANAFGSGGTHENVIKPTGTFGKAVAKLNAYHTTAKGAVEKVITANTAVNDGGLTDATAIDAAKIEVDKISSADDNATCKISSDTDALKTVVNKAYPDSSVNAAQTADADRYTNYLDAVKVGDAVAKLADISSTDVTDEATATAAKAATDAYDALSETLQGKISSILTDKVPTLKTNYNTYATGLQDDAVAEFLAAMKAYGTGTAAPAYSTTSDTNINALCTKYLALAEVDPDGTVRNKNTVAPEVARLKGLVRTQWNERDAVLTAAIKAVSGKITPAAGDTTSITVINDLKKLDEQFYNSVHDDVEAVNNSALFTILDDALLNLSGVKSNATTLKTNTAKALTDASAAEPIILQIANLPDIDDTNYTSAKSTVQGVRDAYDAKTSTIQAQVGNYSKLTKAEADIKALEKQVDDAVTALKALDESTPSTSTINSIKAKYEAANNAYTALKDGQKADTKLDVIGTDDEITAKLAAVKTKIESYEEKAEAIAEAEKLISALPKGTDASEALQIAQALAAVNAAEADLSVDPTTIEGIGALNDAVKKVISVIYPNGTADAAAVAAAVKPVQDLIEPLKTLNIQTAADVRQVKAARAAYDALISDLETGKADGKTAMREALKNQLNTLVDAEEAANKIDSVNITAITAFVNAVKAIGGGDLDAITEKNGVNETYIGQTTTARGRYNALSDEQKEMVAADEVEGVKAKLAYEKLLIAEANVNSAAALPEIAKLIKAVPNATTLDVNDAAAVAKVKAAQTAYEALSDNVKAQLVSGNYITVNERDNYLDAVAKVANAENEAAAKVAIDAIKALIQLPEAFENQEQVTPIQVALAAAEKAYNALTDEQKALVTNASDLATYRTNYNALLKRYVDPLYADAAKIDVEAELTAEDIAKIAELKTYVEGKYIDTANIKDFEPKVYDKLIEALDKVQKEENALENATIAAIEAVTYDGTAKTPAITVTDKAGKTLTEEDYTATYINNINAGTATVVVTTKSGSVYTGVKTAEFEITPADIKTAAKANKIADKTYTKKAIQPAVTVKAGDKALASGTDYTVSYAKNTNIGKATVTIKGTGNYKGTITTSFIIKPAKGKVTKLAAGKKQITVSYETQKAQSGKTGYRIICKAKGIKATGTNTTAAGKKVIKKLKSGKTYQVKVRAYKTIGGTKYYGAYSAVKKVKVK